MGPPSACSPPTHLASDACNASRVRVRLVGHVRGLRWAGPILRLALCVQRWERRRESADDGHSPRTSAAASAGHGWNGGMPLPFEGPSGLLGHPPARTHPSGLLGHPPTRHSPARASASEITASTVVTPGRAGSGRRRKRRAVRAAPGPWPAPSPGPWPAPSPPPPRPRSNATISSGWNCKAKQVLHRRFVGTGSLSRCHCRCARRRIPRSTPARPASRAIRSFCCWREEWTLTHRWHLALAPA